MSPPGRRKRKRFAAHRFHFHGVYDCRQETHSHAHFLIFRVVHPHVHALDSGKVRTVIAESRRYGREVHQRKFDVGLAAQRLNFRRSFAGLNKVLVAVFAHFAEARHHAHQPEIGLPLLEVGDFYRICFGSFVFLGLFRAAEKRSYKAQTQRKRRYDSRFFHIPLLLVIHGQVAEVNRPRGFVLGVAEN